MTIICKGDKGAHVLGDLGGHPGYPCGTIVRLRMKEIQERSFKGVDNGSSECGRRTV